LIAPHSCWASLPVATRGKRREKKKGGERPTPSPTKLEREKEGGKNEKKKKEDAKYLFEEPGAKIRHHVP